MKGKMGGDDVGTRWVTIDAEDVWVKVVAVHGSPLRVTHHSVRTFDENCRHRRFVAKNISYNACSSRSWKTAIYFSKDPTPGGCVDIHK